VKDPDPSEVLFVALDVARGRRVNIPAPVATEYRLEQPLPTEKLQQSLATVQAVAPRGHEVVRAGQIHLGERLWIWHETRLPSLDGQTWLARLTPWNKGHFVGVHDDR
jgi:hypothetical protein